MNDLKCLNFMINGLYYFIDDLSFVSPFAFYYCKQNDNIDAYSSGVKLCLCLNSTQETQKYV